MLPLFYVIMVRRSSRGVYRGVHRRTARRPVTGPPAPGSAGRYTGTAAGREACNIKTNERLIYIYTSIWYYGIVLAAHGPLLLFGGCSSSGASNDLLGQDARVIGVVHGPQRHCGRVPLASNVQLPRACCQMLGSQAWPTRGRVDHGQANRTAKRVAARAQ
jgi:hypothetical protein